MIFVCDQVQLNAGLSKIGKAVTSNPTNPMLSNVYIEPADDGVRLVGGDDVNMVSVIVPGEVEGDNKFMMPYKLFSAISSNMPKKEVSLVWDENSNCLSMYNSESKVQLYGSRADHFPVPQTIDSETLAYVSGRVLEQAINRTIFAVSNDDDKPILHGVETSFSEEKFTMAGVDMVRLAAYTGELTGISDETVGTSYVIPVKALALVSEYARDSEVKLTFNDRFVEFEIESDPPIHIVSSLLQGKFANWTNLIPDDYTTQIKMKVSDALSTAINCESIAKISGRNIMHIKADTSGKAFFYAFNESGSSVRSCDASVFGENNEIILNSTYFLDLLNAIRDEEEVIIEISTPTHPCVFKVENNEYEHLIMPTLKSSNELESSVTVSDKYF